MRATVIHAAHDVRLEDVPDPTLLAPTDAIVQVAAACVCGSDLWRYRGIQPVPEPIRIGHEFIGTVTDVGAEVTSIKPGDFVIAPFAISDNTCVHCRHGVQTSCEQVAWWGEPDHAGLFADGGQGEAVRVPLADGTLVPVPGGGPEELIPSLLTLSDVMGTGHHAAVAARVAPGAVVAVVGDGAVGLSAVLAAHRLGAERVIAMSRHADRQALAKEFGATDLVETRGDTGAAEIKELTGGVGADCVLECVGTKESMAQALASARPGGRVGFVGVPAGGPELPVRQLFNTNVSVAGGVAPVRSYIPELLDDVLAGTINPGKVFTESFALADVADAYAAMDERTAIKSLLRP